MEIVYIAHPLAGGETDNRAKARRWIKWAWDHFPQLGFVADWILISEICNRDPNTIERELQFDEEVVRRCDQLWLCGGRISPGMQREKNAAMQAKRKIFDLTSFGSEPPTEDVLQRFPEILDISKHLVKGFEADSEPIPVNHYVYDGSR